MLFDLYLVTDTTTKTPDDVEAIYNGFINRTINIDEFESNNNVVKYSKVINNISTTLVTSSYNLSYKQINKLKFNSLGVYNWELDSDTKSVLAI